ncbi:MULTISPECIES: hypothetical protein [Rhizobium]|uniref:Uncharacterized protein n=1 Tax=Rhizobium wenxiniae TaxID=1737357 RepID=A0A7W9YCY6_9HYPH|nr:hypothetical protein [Rhizobium wenxiniae]MBB6166306.1 hypothetical protein [Rhizobium wenxiniae]
MPRTDHCRHDMMKNPYDVTLVVAGDLWLIDRTTAANTRLSGGLAVLPSP